MNLVVAVDFSEITRRVLDVVAGLPAARGAQVYLVHAAEPDPDFVGWEAGPDVVRDQVAAMYQREHRQLEELAAGLRAKGLSVTALLIQGPTIEVILDEIERRRADLVVVGTHGHGAAYDLIVGSVSAGVIRKARVPVLVVPLPARDA